MKVLVYRWDIFPYDDIINELKEQGHIVDVLAFPVKSHIKDEAFEEKLAGYLEHGGYNAVFSINYYTTISNVCHKYKIKYTYYSQCSIFFSIYFQ